MYLPAAYPSLKTRFPFISGFWGVWSKEFLEIPKNKIRGGGTSGRWNVTTIALKKGHFWSRLFEF